MKTQIHSLESLRSQHWIRSVEQLTKKTLLTPSDFPFKINQGGITLISGELGAGKSSLILRALALNPNLKVCWIEDQFEFYPKILEQLQIALNRFVFIRGGEESLWVAHHVVRSGLFQVVHLYLNDLTLAKKEPIHLRRIQLASEQAQVTTLISTNSPHLSHWGIYEHYSLSMV